MVTKILNTPSLRKDVEITIMEQSLQQAGTYLPIEDHGIIGDLHTVALVGKNGTIDWCCIPAFDAPSIFGALLDAEKGGFFSIAPHATHEMRHNQYYLPETNILITRFFTLEGVGEITDFMPIQSSKEHTKHHRIVRAVRVVRGQLTFELVCRPAFRARSGLSECGFESGSLLFSSLRGRWPQWCCQHVYVTARSMGLFSLRKHRRSRA